RKAQATRAGHRQGPDRRRRPTDHLPLQPCHLPLPAGARNYDDGQQHLQRMAIRRRLDGLEATPDRGRLARILPKDAGETLAVRRRLLCRRAIVFPGWRIDRLLQRSGAERGGFAVGWGVLVEGRALARGAAEGEDEV